MLTTYTWATVYPFSSNQNDNLCNSRSKNQNETSFTSSMSNVSHDVLQSLWVFSAECTTQVSSNNANNCNTVHRMTETYCVNTVHPSVSWYSHLLPPACTSSSRGLHGLTDRQIRDDKAELVWLWTSSISYLSVTLSDWHYILPVISKLMTWKAPCIFGVIFLKSHACLKVIQHTYILLTVIQ